MFNFLQGSKTVLPGMTFSSDMDLKVLYLGVLKNSFSIPCYDQATKEFVKRKLELIKRSNKSPQGSYGGGVPVGRGWKAAV